MVDCRPSNAGNSESARIETGGNCNSEFTEATIATERPASAVEFLCQLLWIEVVLRGQRSRTPTAVNLSFLDRSRYFFIQVALHLSSQGLNGPRSVPTATQKIW
jgi:hypothetical protein